MNDLTLDAKEQQNITAEAILDAKFSRMIRLGFSYPPPVDSIEQVAGDWIKTFANAGFDVTCEKFMYHLDRWLEKQIGRSTDWPMPGALIGDVEFQIACGVTPYQWDEQDYGDVDGFDQRVSLLQAKLSHIRDNVFIAELRDNDTVWPRIDTCLAALREGAPANDLALIHFVLTRVGEQFDLEALVQAHAERAENQSVAQLEEHDSHDVAASLRH